MKNETIIIHSRKDIEGVNRWDKIEIESKGKTIDGLFLRMFPIEKNKEVLRILEPNLNVGKYLIDMEDKENFISDMGVSYYKIPSTKKGIERARVYQQKLEQAYGKTR